MNGHEPRGYITERDIIDGIRAIRASWQVAACVTCDLSEEMDA